MITTKRAMLTTGFLAVLAAGCASPGVAATVNDSDISASFVLSLRVENEGRVTVSAEQFRSDLSRLIFTEAMLTTAESDFGLVDLDSPESGEVFLQAASPQELAYVESIAVDPETSTAAVAVAITQLLLRSEVRAALAADESNLEDVWQNDQSSLVQVCVRHILVPSEPEAQDVLDRLAAGEDFGSVATEVSLDTTSPSGVLPCPSSPASFVSSFAAAVSTLPIGEPSTPVQTQFGWHTIIVDSRESPTSLDELAEDPLGWIPDDILDSFWSSWLNDVVDRADIVVRSDIGTWYPPVDGILPPRSSP